VGSASCSPNGFINETSATDAQLLALWQGAQKAIGAAPWPPTPVTNPSAPLKPADPRALTVLPACTVTIIAIPDALAQSLPGYPNVVHKTNPTGIFACPGSDSPTGYCGGETIGNTIEVAASTAASAGTTGYEMQNVILQKLGYSTSGR
jgi:hypothetical protein